MIKRSTLSLMVVVVATTTAFADELTLAVERDLVRLGYGTGEADGEETVETMIAIAKYQADHGYAITGQASEKLSGALAKTTSVGNAPTVRALKPDKRAAVVVSEEGLNAAREACLKDKMMISQSAGQNNNVTKEIKGQLIDQAAQAAVQATGIGMAQQVYTLYSQWKSKSESDTSKENESSAMAKSLGISEEDVNACQRPAD